MVFCKTNKKKPKKEFSKFKTDMFLKKKYIYIYKQLISTFNSILFETKDNYILSFFFGEDMGNQYLRIIYIIYFHRSINMTVNLILLKYIYNTSETFLSIIWTYHQNFSNKYYKRFKYNDLKNK